MLVVLVRASTSLSVMVSLQPSIAANIDGLEMRKKLSLVHVMSRLLGRVHLACLLIV